MDNATTERLESSFNLLAPRGEELVRNFYDKLFSSHPEVRPMFPTDMNEQRGKLLAAIGLVMKNIKNPEALQQPLKDMGARHVKYGTKEAHYPVVRDTLVGVMADMAGSAWNSQLTGDWNGALDFVASVMIDGQHEAEQRQAA